METPKQLVDTRVNAVLGDTPSPYPMAFAAKPANVLDRLVRAEWDGPSGTRLAARSRTPIPQVAATAARWEISYIPSTCVILRPHVCLHAMEIATRRVAPNMAGFQPERYAHDGLSPRNGADTPRLAAGPSPEGTREAVEALRLARSPSRADRGHTPRTVAPRRPNGRVGAWRTPMRRLEPRPVHRRGARARRRPLMRSSQHTQHTHTDSHRPVFFEFTGFGGPIPSV